MKFYTVRLLLLLFFMCGFVSAQIVDSSPTVPRLIRFSGNVAGASDKPETGIVGLTFSLYTDEQGITPLWQETQNVKLDSAGGYNIFLGASKPDGLPLDLFASGQAQWLGVQAQGQPEQPRVLLLAVPYALKAADAETVGGLPPSAFARVMGNSPAGSEYSSSSHSVGSVTSTRPQDNQPVTTLGGTINYIPLWTGTTAIGNSTIFQSGGNVGIGTTNPTYTLHLAIPGGNGGLRISNSSNTTTDYSALDFMQGGANIAGVYTHANALYIESYSGSPILINQPGTGGNVGIGTTTPSTQLDIVGSMKLEGSGNGITFPDGSNQVTAGLTTLTTVSANYTSTVNLSCPSGYVVVVASCSPGGAYFFENTSTVVYPNGSPVLNDQNSLLPPGAVGWVDYLTPSQQNATGVHCDVGSGNQSQAELRCAKQ
jgi:hypothetical protein